jgi:hypothetical protein
MPISCLARLSFLLDSLYPEEYPDMTDTHFTTHTRFVEVNGDKFAYRRWGNNTTGVLKFFPQGWQGSLSGSSTR